MDGGGDTAVGSSVSDGSNSVGNSPSRTGGGSRLRIARPRPPAVYNRDVIPSPRNSPMKSGAPLDQYLQRTAAPASKVDK